MKPTSLSRGYLFLSLSLHSVAPWLSNTSQYCKKGFNPPPLPPRLPRFLPEGKRSITGWLSTCSVALPPLRVNRTTWYLPSLTITAPSSMMMSSVPTLKITPIFPRSCGRRRRERRQRKRRTATLNEGVSDISRKNKRILDFLGNRHMFWKCRSVKSSTDPSLGFPFKPIFFQSSTFCQDLEFYSVLF